MPWLLRAVLSSASLLLAPAAYAADPELPDLGSSAARARESNKSYAIPAAEIFGFDFLLNRINRQTYGEDYSVSTATIKRNLNGAWGADNDPFNVNQFSHPYQGPMYH